MRRRANNAAAAAPNSKTIGGAGTSVPPFDPPVLPPELEEDELELLLEELELEELPEEPVDVLLPPKLEEPPVAPDELLVELPPENHGHRNRRAHLSHHVRPNRRDRLNRLFHRLNRHRRWNSMNCSKSYWMNWTKTNCCLRSMCWLNRRCWSRRQ